MKDMYMKRFISLFLCLTLGFCALTMLAACDTPAIPDNNGVTVVCANFAGLDFTRSLLAHYTENGGTEMVRVSVLGKPGQDMHSFEPTAADIISLANADVVVCTGAEGWLDAALKSSGNTAARTVSMMEVCDTVAGEHDHDHAHDHPTDGSADQGSCALIGQDEHVWLSVENACRITQAIADALMQTDTENAAVWQTCAERYGAELTALRGEFQDLMETATRDTVVLADRHPFVYLFRELELNCVAAFPGCSSETSASFETQTKLIEAVKSLSLPYIFIIEGSDGKVAEVVAGETGAQVLTLHSMQVVNDYENTTYLAVMRANLENLKKALQ